MKRSLNPKKFFTKEESDKIINAIKKSELITSGEIRVHIERNVRGDIYKKAVKIFNKLKMYNTKDRNGCLILLELKHKKFAVIGDIGLHEKVGQDFWKNIADCFHTHFKEDKFLEGLESGIILIGEKLKKYFPYQSDDVNELPDEISYK